MFQLRNVVSTIFLVTLFGCGGSDTDPVLVELPSRLSDSCIGGRGWNLRAI